MLEIKCSFLVDRESILALVPADIAAKHKGFYLHNHNAGRQAVWSARVDKIEDGRIPNTSGNWTRTRRRDTRRSCRFLAA